jgi:tetratricopeptide (TPR) repeat protein
LQYMQLRNFAQAAAAYQTALRYNPRSSAAYGGLSVIYLAQGRPAEAIRAGQAAMRYSAEDSEARRKRLIGVIQAVRIDAVP